MIARLRSRYGRFDFAQRRRLRWKLTGSYTIVAALTFFIIQAILFIMALTLFGINPFRADIGIISSAFAPSLMKDIEIITRQELAQTNPDPHIMEYNIKQKWADFLPQTPVLSEAGAAVSTPLFASDHVMTVVILDNNKQPVLILPEFEQGMNEQAVFDAAAFANDEYEAMITAVFANTTPPQPYAHLTSEAVYLNYAAQIRSETDALLGAQLLTLRLPTPTSFFLLALGMFLVGMSLFTVAAAGIGTLFGWRTARGLSERLTHLAQRTAAWGQGDFSAQIEDETEDEIRDLGQNLNQMAAELQMLLANKEQLAVLEERNRLARDLHDSVKQQAFASAAQIGAARALMQQNPVQAEIHLTQAADLTDQIRLELTALIQQLRPFDVESKGLTNALRDMIANWSAQQSIKVASDIAEVVEVETAVSDTLFRVTQEALANISKHSHATHVILTLTQSNGTTILEIQDNGKGFDIETAQRGVGLDSMRERVTAVNGTISIKSSQKGTIILVEVGIEGK